MVKAQVSQAEIHWYYPWTGFFPFFSPPPSYFGLYLISSLLGYAAFLTLNKLLAIEHSFTSTSFVLALHRTHMQTDMHTHLCNRSLLPCRPRWWSPPSCCKWHRKNNPCATPAVGGTTITTTTTQRRNDELAVSSTRALLAVIDQMVAKGSLM